MPAYEIAIGRIMNQLAAKEVLTVTEKQAHIHVSGHPGKPELAALYGWLRPKLIVPVHGEIRHMHEQARFAVEQGVPAALLQQNGHLCRLARSEGRRGGKEWVRRGSAGWARDT